MTRDPVLAGCGGRPGAGAHLAVPCEAHPHPAPRAATPSPLGVAPGTLVQQV